MTQNGWRKAKVQVPATSTVSSAHSSRIGLTPDLALPPEDAADELGDFWAVEAEEEHALLVARHESVGEAEVDAVVALVVEVVEDVAWENGDPARVTTTRLTSETGCSDFAAGDDPRLRAFGSPQLQCRAGEHDPVTLLLV